MDHGKSEDIDIVIVGGGICGLATAIALHRKGMKSVVLERSEVLRATGGGIAIQANGWRALDELGVASMLRPNAILIEGVRDVFLKQRGKQQEELISFSNIGEARVVKRSDLLEVLAHDLPFGTIRFGCQILSLKLDKVTSFPILQLKDGSTIRAKVLIGCDGANSVVADFLELRPKKLFTSSAVSGYTYYSNGHGFAPEIVRTRRDSTLCGIAPVTDKLVFWFVVHQWHSKDSRIFKDPEMIKQMALETIKGFPPENRELVNNCGLDQLLFTHLRHRAPWDILLGQFRKGTVTVAGDAMHVIGPFIGQGASAALEDAVVLGRSLARKLQANKNDLDDYFMVKKIEEAMDEYVKERRMRLVGLSTHTYLIGSLMDSSSLLVKLIIIVFLVTLFRNQFGHARYNCGNL